MTSGVHIAALVNPTAGKGRARRLAPAAIDHMRRLGAQVTVVQGRDRHDALDQLRVVLGQGANRVAAIGGDGTVSLALQAVAGTAIPLGVVALGTGDDVARQHGLPRRDPELSAKIVVNGVIKDVDAAQVLSPDGRNTWFLTALASGFDSEVNERANTMRWPRGDLRYVVAMLRLLPRFRATAYVIDIDGTAHTRAAMLIAVGNGPSYGGGMLVCPSADTADGLVTLTVVNDISRGTFLRLFPRVYRGTHVSHPAVEVFHGTTVRLSSTGRSAWADGERIADLPVSITCVRAAVRLLT